MLTQLLVAASHDGKRLDALLHGIECPGLGPLSRHKARVLCELGAVAIGGVRAAASQRVRSGDSVQWAPAFADLSLDLKVPVVFADHTVVVVHKPPGLAVHGGPLVEHSIAAALELELPGAGLAQRLDREASGLLLIGRDAASLKALGEAMERGDIEREYLAITVGVIDGDDRTIDLPLRVTDEPRGNRPKTVVDSTGQRSVTHVHTEARRKHHTLVRVRLETGRTHQIRAHLAAIGNALLGDPRYGDEAANQQARATFGIGRTMLHATRLCFPHPGSGERVEVTAVHEPDFVRLFPKLASRDRQHGPPD